MTAAAGFTGDHDIYAGEIAGVRTFVLRSDGTLWPVSHPDRPWVDGDNVARCARHDPAGAPRCGCGFWSYGTAAATAEQPAARHVLGVVENWGRVTLGTRGVRAQNAAIRAIWLGPRVSASLAARVAARYPRTAVFRDREQMLRQYPPTPLARYVPDAPGARRRSGPQRWLLPVQALVAVAVAALTSVDAVLDPSQRDGPLGPTPGVIPLFVVVAVVAPLVRGLLADREARHATRLVRKLNANAIIGLVALSVLSSYTHPWFLHVALVLPWAVYLVWRWRRPFPPPVRRTLGGLLLRAVSANHRRVLAHV